MKAAYVDTENTTIFDALCRELSSPASKVGPSLAMVTGQAGRGKTEAAKHWAIHSDAVYLPPMNIRTPAMILREICFELAMLRPGRTESCLTLIGEEMAKHRRLIMVDEADLLRMDNLEMLRNLNERCACPILLIGEESLKGRIASRRRLVSRIRRKVEFGPISQVDIIFFFRIALDVGVANDVALEIYRHSGGDWRPVLTLAAGLERAMVASGINDITKEMVHDVATNAE